MSDDVETTEPSITASAAAAASHASPTEEEIAKALHERSVFAHGPHAITWDKLDGVARQRRVMQAHDLVELGYVQVANQFYGAADARPIE